jgi:hypothetical protein
MSFKSIIENKKIYDWLGSEKITAFYPSSGNDTKPISFLSQYFLDKRIEKLNVKAPNLFIYVDEKDYGNIDFEDNDTIIEIIETVKLQENLNLYLIEWTSKPKKITKKLALIRIKAKNSQVGYEACMAGFIPDFFIGVTDGCSFGGNDHCVNTLKYQSHMNNMPKYWVTDHFTNAEIPNQLSDGDIIYSKDKNYPYCFKKIGLLSSKWGNYGHNNFLRGATLFSIHKK